MDIDEAGYVNISLNDYISLHVHGIAGWFHMIIQQGVQAPLAPALASLIDWTTGPRISNAFFVSAIAYGVILASAYGLTKEWTAWGRRIAVFFVGCSPVLLDYARGFNFAELAAAAMSMALYFAHRSRGFSRTVPALAWGACLGLLLLSRTMTVAFLPGLLLAGLVPVFARRSWSGLLRIGGGVVVGGAVAATWYAHNFQSVYSYLTSAGYGAQAAQYGAARSLFAPGDWYRFWMAMTDSYLFAAEGLFILVGWLLSAWSGPRVWRQSQGAHRSQRAVSQDASTFRQIRTLVASDPVVLSCVIVAMVGLAALMSSRNQGSAFIAPLVVPLVLVASHGFMVLVSQMRVGRSRYLTKSLSFLMMAVLAGGAGLAAGLTFLPMSVSSVRSAPWPAGERLTLWDSRGTLRIYEDAGSVSQSTSPGPASTVTGRAWLAASAFVDDEIWARLAALGNRRVVVFTFNDRLVNVNTVNLDSLVRHRTGLELVLMSPLPGDSSVSDYVQELKSVTPLVGVVATVSGEADEFQPAVPPTIGAEYARTLRFHPFARRQLPDGQWLVLWSTSK